MSIAASQSTPHTDQQVAAFIARWQGVALTAATELSSSQTFILELCALLGVDTPLPTEAASYLFERPITFAHGDGSTSPGRIDCYKRSHFVWESKKFKYLAKGGAAHGTAMLTARAQAAGYARALPRAELAAHRLWWWPWFPADTLCVARSGRRRKRRIKLTAKASIGLSFPELRGLRLTRRFTYASAGMAWRADGRMFFRDHCATGEGVTELCDRS